jgi:2-polyprenyl-3-methyl-5-hydroxy-6-metoxy-1,4-benzoquinol methylase
MRLSSLHHRQIVPEIMDGPDIAPAEHLDALEGLRRINRVSHTSQTMLEPILAMARQNHLTKFSLLDIACGGGDVPLGIALGARAQGMDIGLTLLDRSPTALDRAAKSATDLHLSCRCIAADVLQDFPRETFDVVTCSLFLHHVETSRQAVELFEHARNSAKRMVVISDLRRCRGGYLAAWIGTRILSRSRIVHHDGPASVRAAWTIPEIRQFAASANMPDVLISRASPFRMLLTWEPPHVL